MIATPPETQPAGWSPARAAPEPVDRYELRNAADDAVLAVIDDPAATAVVLGASGSDRDLYVHVVNACGLADLDDSVQRLRRVAFDDLGGLILPAPGPVRDLLLEPMAGGMIRATWVAETRRFSGLPAAATFAVYQAAPGAIDYEGEAVSVAAGGLRGSIDLGPFADGMAVTVAVRAISGEGVEESNVLTETATADAQAPAPVAVASLEVTAQ